MAEIMSFSDFVKLLIKGLGQFNSTPDPKIVCYSPRKRPEMTEIMSFSDFVKLLIRGLGPFNFTPNPKTV